MSFVWCARHVISSRGRIVQSPRGQKCAVVVLGAVNTARKVVVLRNAVPLVKILHDGQSAPSCPFLRGIDRAQYDDYDDDGAFSPSRALYNFPA